MQNLQKEGLSFDVINARFVKPLDVELLEKLQSEYVITVEDNVLLGGFGSMVAMKINEMGKNVCVKNFAYRDQFIPQGKIADLQSEYGVSCEEIQEYITSILK